MTVKTWQWRGVLNNRESGKLVMEVENEKHPGTNKVVFWVDVVP
jgi:hypothetical protein